jgi:hypothetical protein
VAADGEPLRVRQAGPGGDMIVFTATSEADAITFTPERGKSGRWYGIFRPPGSSLFRVHADVYPGGKAHRIATTVNGGLETGA